MTLHRLAVLAAACIIPVAAQAQDSFPVVDWNAWGTTAAANSVTEDAGRRGSAGYKAPRSSASKASGSAARARRNCAKARGQAAEGLRDPRLAQILTLCNRAGH